MADIENPYAPPKAIVDDMLNVYSGPTALIKILSPKGRLGRLRYIAYDGVLSFINNIMVSSVVIPVLFKNPEFNVEVLNLLMSIPFLVIFIFISIKRSHDMNRRGWMAFIVLIPIVHYIFYFIPGTQGENRFGLPTPPNTKKVKIITITFWTLEILLAMAVSYCTIYLINGKDISRVTLFDLIIEFYALL